MTQPDPTTVREEIAAMRRVVAALEPLDRAAQDRVVGWLFDRYHLPTDDEEQVRS